MKRISIKRNEVVNLFKAVKLHKQINLLQAAYPPGTLELFGKKAANSRFFQFHQFRCGFLTCRGSSLSASQSKRSMNRTSMPKHSRFTMSLGEVPSKGCGELAFKRGGVGDDEHIIVFFAIVKQDQMMCLGSFFRHTLVIFAGGFLLIHLFLLMDGLMEAVALCRYLLLHAQWVNRR
jgi:hypothetical protein